MFKTVRPRVDDRLTDLTQLLVRFNDDHDPAMALRNALREATTYRVIPGYERSGALTISVFIVADEREAQILTGGLGQSRYGLATVGALRHRGYEVVPTDVEEQALRVFDPRRHIGGEYHETHD